MKQILLILTLTYTLINPCMAYSADSFSDVNSSDPNFESINQVVNEYKIMQVLPDKAFKGKGTIDRYNYSVILLNTIELLNRKMLEIEQPGILETSATAGNENSKYQNIPDLEKNHWAYHKALTLLKLGFIRTYADNSFKGNKNVEYIGFAIGMGRLMKIIYDDAPPVLKRKWQKEITRSVKAIKGVPSDSPVFAPLKLAIESNIIDPKPGNALTKDINRYDAASYITRLISKLDELRQYIVFSKIG